MFSKNNIKMNDKKQAEKINQYGIKKFNAGTASVLIASGFLFLGGAAQAADTTKQEVPVETATKENTTEKVETSKGEVAEKTAESTVVKTSAVKTKLQEKINQLNDLFVTLAGKDLTETQQKLTVDAATELNKAKDLVVNESVTQAQVDAQTVALENSISFLNKSLEGKESQDKKVEGKETKSEKKDLEKTISEAKVINQSATAFAEKSVKEESKKAEIKAAVATAKKQIAKALDVFNSDSSTKEDSERERKELERAIEAVYATMQRAGHRGKLEGLLAGETTTEVSINQPTNKVVVSNFGAITEEEARAIEKEIRTANPTLTADDKITVKREGNLGLPAATITLANGRVDQYGNSTHDFAIGDVAYGSAGEKNYNQLREAINWFDFATASITYGDGTKVGPVEYVNNPATVNFTSSKGRQERGRFTMVRTILESPTHPELVGKKTNDPAFLAAGLAKYTLWKTYDHVKHEVQQGLSEGRGNNEIFEVLQEGMRFDVPTKVKGYTLSATVSSLSRKKVTTETYTLNKANGEPENINRSPVDGVVQREDVIVTRQDPNWSHLRTAGFRTVYTDATGREREGLTAFAPAYDGGNVGVKFQLSATYNGRPVAVNAIAVDSEDLSVAEFTQFESDGTPWEEFMRLNKNKTNSQGLFPNRNVDHNFTYTFDRKTDAKLTTGYNLSEWANKTETGYGSQLFGPFDSGINRGYDLPIGITQNVENLGVYINANGSQSATVGFVIYDGGDAPSSYGSAQHIIGNFNSEKNGTQVVHTQPYLGDVPADSDFRTTIGEPNGAWVLDDLVNSEDYKEISLVSGTTKVTNSKGQSGTYLLDGKNPVIRMEDGTQVAIKNGEILATANTLKGGDGLPIKGLYNQATRGLGVGNLPDEGEGQLLDSRVATKYTLRRASENEYVLKGVKVNRGVNNDVAYVRGWVDFNGNGKFDLYESSELVTANADGTYDITFKNTPQLLNTSVDNLGVRLRVSVDKNDLRLPTGLASSGEVEDFVANVIHQPRGTSHVTKGLQGQKQEVNLPTNAMFTASGKTIVSNYKQWAQIDNNTAPKMVLNDTVVKSEEPTGKTVEVKDNLSQTIYNGTEVVVKDARGNTLGTAVKVTNKLTGRAEYYLSEYTEYDTAGNKVGVYKLNEGSTEGKNIQNGSLNYTKISFQPEPGYVGTAKGVAIRAWDDNGSHTGWEATEDTIRDSLTSTTLADKDKILENTNNGTNGTKTMDTSYIPTVIDVRPVGEDSITTDSQGKKQSAKPQIPVYGTVETETGDRITDSRYSFEILNKKEKIKLADTLESKKVTYDIDTEVSKPTTITLADGKVVTYTPDKEKLPARAKIAEDADVVITGTGSVVLNNVRLTSGKTIPAGASPDNDHPVREATVVTLPNGSETTIPAGEKIPRGAKLKAPLVSSANNTWHNVTFSTGDVIPKTDSNNKQAVLAKETSISQIVAKGDVVKIDGKYRATNTIPAGTTIKKILPLNQVVLPSATHLDPVTGAITEVPRSYDLANTNDSKVTITGEGVYELVKDSSGKPTGEVTFTPEPGFVGRGTGVDLVQPDIDYNDKVAGDPVTEKYGTDYGRAKYTPIVTPNTKASITRTIHYVYESDNDATATSQDSYKNNNPILSINNEPVTRSQTLNFNRTYKMFDEDGILDQSMVAANTVRDVNGTQYTAGTEIPKGTKFSQGTLIISDWKHGENNEVMSSVVSPTVKGYTANVVTLEYNAPNATGEMAHIKDAKDIGAYKPVTGNTKDVGTYKPASSAIRSDDKDNFDMYVVYKADKQKANVTYIDLDATGDARILEVQTAVATPTTGADAKTTYNVEKLQGKSHTTIPYSTAETIKKYEALGYELVTDDYTNDAEGNAISGGRKFDDDKDVDQPFNVYLRHKKVLRKIKDTQEVTRTIEYKYADTDEVPADKRGKTAASTVTEKLTYERDRTIDHVLAAKEYPTQYAAYKAVADANPYGSDTEFAARKTFYDHITTKAIAPDATPAQKAIVTFGPWTPKGGEAMGIRLSDAEKAKDDKFNLVNSPDVTGYAPDNATVEATTSIDAEAPDYKVTVTYTPAQQKAVVKFVEVDPTNTNKVITPGLAEPVVVTGKSEAVYPTTTATSVTDKIAELVKKGYELVNNGFQPTDKFDKDTAVDQEYVVKLKAKVVDIPSFDPTKPVSNDNPKPTPGVTPIDPNNPNGPKWTEALINAVKVQEEVTRTIKYVYEDGTPVAEADLASVADKKVKTLKFTRPGKINVATGEITYGDWSANQTFEAVTSPVLEKYTAAVAGVTPVVADVPAKTVAATDKDFEEVVVYKAKLITVDPKAPGYKEPKKDQPINPSDPNGPKWTDELLAKLKNTEKVTRTISYTYSTEASELNQAEKDGNKGGTNVAAPFTREVNYTRVAKVNPVTGEITYGEWEAKDNDTTLEGNALPAVAGYVATGDVDSSKKDVTGVNATDKDITEKVVYKALGKYVPVVPKGFTPPTIPNPQYPNNPTDPTKPGTPTTTIPYVPGTTPVGPDGQPLTPKDPNDKTKGYEPPAPTTPTGDTTIVYTKDGSQVAVTHFIEVNSETDKTEKGGVAESVVDTGDAGKAFTKGQAVTDTINALKAKGYTVVDNNYPTDGKFDADSKTNQVYKVLVTAKPITVNPNGPTPTKDEPIDPGNPTGPKWTPELIKELEDGRKEEVKRTINYIYADGTKAKDSVEETKEFKRSATINPVTGKITFGDWSPAQRFDKVTSPTIEKYTPNRESVEAKEVTATADDITETVIYTPSKVPVDPNPTDPNEKVNPNAPVPNDPKGRTYKDLGLVEEVKHTIHYVYEDGSKADEDVVQTLTYTRTAKIDSVTGALSEVGDWTAKNGDDFTAVNSPVKEGYIVSKATSTAINDVPATAEDTEETIIYRKLGSYIPVVPEGVIVPPGTDTTPKVYPKNPNDPTKPGEPTTTIPVIPGTTPVGPNGRPLEKDPNGGYKVPPIPTDPTENTTITYVKDGSQVAVTKFVDTTGKGLEPSVVDTGDTGKAFTKDADVTATINKILARGYEKVANVNANEKDYPSTAADKVFDADASTNQEYTVTFKPIIKDVPTDPNSEKPTPGQPVVPGDNNGPKWPESVKNLKTTDTVKRTIKYVYEDGKPVIDPVTGTQKVVEQTVEFTRPAQVNLATGDITYGAWTPAKELAAVASPTATDIPALANHIVSTETVPAVIVAAEAEDITETVIYRKVKPITVQPNDPTPTKDTPIDKDNPNGPKWTEELIKKLEDARKEEVTRTISYTYSTDEKELKEADAAKAGINVADAFTNRVEFKRAVTIDPKNGEFTYGPWVATNNDTTLEGKAELPKVEGYIATGDVDSSKKDVTGVNATDKDITEKVVYKALGKYVPVVPEGFDKPNINKPQYPNSDDPSKPGTPDTLIPHVPGTTPVGPDGQPLTPKDPNDKTKGYVPPAPTDPTKDTSIIYVKDGSQIAVTKFVDTTGKGLEPSVVDSGDTGKAFAKDAEVTATINKILARGYEKVANVNASEKDYPSTAADKVFDADASTNQEFTVTFKAKVVDIPTNPTTPGYVKPEPGQPVVPGENNGPKWPESVKDLKTTEAVTRTIKYVYEDATPVGDDKLGTAVAGKKVQTLEFTRTAKVNLATGEIEYGKWTPKTTDGFEAVATPTIDGYTSALVNNPATSDVPAKTVTADAEDYEEVVIYKAKQTVIDPNDPNFDPDKPVNPKDPNGQKYKDLKLKEDVKRTITYTYADDVADTTKRGAEAEPKYETTVSFTRTATVNGATGEITYSEWAAKDNDTTLEGKATVPVKPGYVAIGDVEASKKDVTGVNATDKDIVEKVIYKDLGKFVPVVPEGFTPPTIPNSQYPNDPKDPTKPGTPTTTIPYVPGTTPVGPNGKPLTPKDPEDPKQGYNPPVPTHPTEDTTIVYVKGGSQVAVTHFIEVNSATDKTEKGGVAQSIVDTGDTGKAFTKGAEVEKTIAALKVKGYTVVENNYPADGKFDADATTNQEYKVLVTVKPVTVNPNDPAPTPGKPIDPNNPTGPKWTPELIKELEDGRKDEVKRTINYVYADGKKAADSVQETKEFKRPATINPITGKITFGEWSPANQIFGEVTSPEIKNYTPDKATVPAKEVAAGADDVTETVIYTTKPVTLDPSKPTDPNTPNVTPKPDDKVPNDPKGRTYKELGLIEEVTHTVHYRLADGTDAGIEDNVQTLTFTRTADLDPITGAISNYSDWKAKGDDTTIDAVPTPAKEGYVASAKASTERANVKATDKDSEETIIYRKLGSYVPVIPEGVTPPANTDLTPKPYPNDPKDPTKPGTPTETPVVPYIPGTTPIGPDGKPLTPKDPNDPTKGYEVPKQPTDPTQDTRITYVKEGSQVALIHFVKADGTAVHVSVAEAGVTGQAIKTANVDKVKADLEAKGYEVVAPTDPAYTTEREAFYGEANRKYDDKDDKGAKGISQVYYVIVKEGITPIDPDKPLTPTTPDLPKPGDKVPGDPKQRTFEQLGLIEEVNRTINYRYANTDKVEEAKRGTEAAETVNQKLRYTRKGDLNKVTGEITYTSDWTKPQTLAEVVSPVIEGYVADIKAAEKVDNVAYNAADSTVNVVYSPLGKYVPKVPEGFEEPKLEKPQYPNDPKDPTKPGTPTTVIPHVPGTTPKDPNGNPLKPVDPNDPTKGYVPPTPENPTEDTTIVYEKDTQKAVTKFVDPTGKPIPGTVTIEESGKSGEPLTKANDVTAEIAKLIAKGYDLVSNNYGKDNDGNFDKDSSKDQEYTVVLTPHIQDVPPFDPKDPNDPKTPQPGQPIDPNNPTGPKWTDELIKQLETTRHVNRTIKYVDEKGNEVSKTVTDKVTFTRGAKLNVVTGEITYNEWTAKDNDTTFVRVVSPVVKGYILKDAKQEIVPASTGLTADSKDENIEVVYIKLGSWVPKVPGGETPIDPIPYPTDPNDPTKPGTDKPKVPYIPGTTPVVPKDPTKPISPDNPLVPLTPVDPNDPTKGYEVPPVPTDPRVDTPINYVADKQKVITNFADENGKVVSTPVVDEGDSGANFNKDKVDEVTKTIEKLEKAGYRVVSNDFPSKDTDRVFDKDKSVDQIFNVKVAERIIPVTPGKPTDPNDPNLPKNPDGTPVTPSTPEPGKPVFPNDPNSPVWPSTVKDMITEKSATRTIKYVDRNGKEITETRVETIKFTRDAKVNLVTGEITYGEWTTDRNDDIFNGYPVPIVKGYIAKDGALESSTKDVKVTPDTIKDINETVVYDKLGSWVPNIPGTPTNPVPYPNDPKDPTKPGNDKPIVPYVPGHTPMVPTDPTKPVGPNNPLVPLKPVDPNDPTKGYEVPNVPNDPTKDTPISYVPVPQPNPTPEPMPAPTPEVPEKPVASVTPKAPAQVKRLANTGTTETNTGLAGLGMAIFGGLLAASRRRKNKED